MSTKKDFWYKVTIALLSFIIILQWVVTIPKPKKAPPKIPAVAYKGKIAIVIDDWGYNLNNLPIIDQIKQPLTASILPHLSYSRAVADELYARGVEIILHLPMEPHEKYRLEKNTIMTTMGAADIIKIIDGDLADLSHAKGVSNHMGSAATEDSRTMETVFGELKKRKLYFLDSYVTAKSICGRLARLVGLAFAKRDVFLDNNEEAEYIKAQVYKLKMKAKLYGSAVGIGHDRKITLEVLRVIMPQLEKEGYRFVPLSELVK